MERKPINIMLVDDDESDRLIFESALAELEIQTIIQTRNNGEQLMDYLTQNGTRLPDVIFLDLNMPRKNGLECLKEIKSNEKFSDIAIAIYSTSASENDINETFIHGANVYIKKPNNFNTLKQVLHKAVTTTGFYRDASLDRENFLLKL